MCRYIPEGLGCSCGPDWYTHNEEYGCTSYMYFLLITCFCMPLSIIIFSYSQLLGALRAVSTSLLVQARKSRLLLSTSGRMRQ